MSKKTIIAAVVAVVMILMSVMSVAALSAGVPEAVAEDTIQRAAPTSIYDYDHTPSHLVSDDDADTLSLDASTYAYRTQYYPGGGNEICHDSTSHTCEWAILRGPSGSVLFASSDWDDCTSYNNGRTYASVDLTEYKYGYIGLTIECTSHGSNEEIDFEQCIHPGH